jgi:hypothetical protein
MSADLLNLPKPKSTDVYFKAYQLAYGTAVDRYIMMSSGVLRTNLEYFRKQIKADLLSHDLIASTYAICDILTSRGEQLYN